MPLYSLVLEHQGKCFSTQLQTTGPEQAVAEFFSDTYPQLRVSAFGSEAPDLESGDIVYVTPMTGLENIWASSVGRGGKYVSVVVVRTVPFDAV